MTVAELKKILADLPEKLNVVGTSYQSFISENDDGEKETFYVAADAPIFSVCVNESDNEVRLGLVDNKLDMEAYESIEQKKNEFDEIYKLHMKDDSHE